eukprot:223858-Chlamydomonas_euryale.AAC.1
MAALPAWPSRKCGVMTGAGGVTSIAETEGEASGRIGATLRRGRTPSLQTARSTPPADGRCTA